MNAVVFRGFALSLPSAIESPHFERTSFRVGKRIFATMTPDGTEAMVPVRPPERVRALLKEHPRTFFSHGAWTERMGALGVRLARADEMLLTELVVAAWRRIAGARARAAFDARS